MSFDNLGSIFSYFIAGDFITRPYQITLTHAINIPQKWFETLGQLQSDASAKKSRLVNF